MNWKWNVDALLTHAPNKRLMQLYLGDHPKLRFELKQVEDGYLLEGEVALYDVSHTVSVHFDEAGNPQRYACDCPWFYKNRPCGHIGVLLKKLSEQTISALPYVYDDGAKEAMAQTVEQHRKVILERKKEEMLKRGRTWLRTQKEEYEKQLQLALSDTYYEIDPEILWDNEGKLTLGFRVGNKKKYVIRNIEEFLERIEHHETYAYGKQLKFEHREDVFDAFGREQLAFMKRRVQDSHEAHYKEYDHGEVGRYIYIAPMDLDDIFDVYGGKEVTSVVELSDADDKVCIHQDKVEDMIRLTLEDKTLVYGKRHLYERVVEDNRIIGFKRYGLDEAGDALRLLKEIQAEPLYILEREYPSFYKYVVSKLLPYITILGEALPVSEAAKDPYTQIRLFADVDDMGEIFVRLEYINEAKDRIPGFCESNETTYEQDLVEAYIRQFASVIDNDHHIAYFNDGREETYTFISDGLPYLSRYCEIYVSDALHNIGKTHTYHIQVGVHVENNLLEIDVESLDIPKQELSDVLRAYRKKRKFHRLKNGTLLNLESQDLQELDDLLQTCHISEKDLGKEALQMETYRMFTVEDKLGNTNHLHLERSKQYQKQLDAFYDKKEAAKLPAHYDTILRDYQKQGYQWLHTLRNFGFHGILADDMGLGKTLQVIALLDDGKTHTSLVVCPSSLIYNWEDEVHKFSAMKVTCICGNAAQRQEAIKTMQEYQLVITSYDYMRRDIEQYEEHHFYYIILDEAQYIKNQNTKNAISVKRLKGDHRLALTGTPIENSLAELWSIFDFLMPNYLYNYRYFQKRFENEIVRNKDEQKQKELKRLVSPFILRRNKREVLQELPEKIEQTQLIDFNEEEKNIYLAYLVQVNEKLQELTNTEGKDKIEMLAMLSRLRQICCDTRLIYDNITSPSSKLKACMDIVASYVENQKKLLLFSSFTSMLDLIAEELRTQGISYYMLTGKTSKENRKYLVDQFQQDDTSVFLISLKAGGTGLNLTAAEAVIHYDPWWNQSAQNQATDRAHRIGQKQTVQVYKLVMKNSIEEKIQRLQKQKKELADMFVEGNDGSISRMSREEMLELFKIS